MRFLSRWMRSGVWLSAAMYACQPQPETGSLRVTVLSATGGAPTPLPAAQVTFTTTGGALSAAVTNSAGVALLAGVPSGAGFVAVIAPCPASAPTTVATSVETPVTVWVCGDVVSASNARTEDIATVVDGRDNTGTCMNDVVAWGQGTAGIGFNVRPLHVDGVPDCHGGLAIFSGGHAPYFTNDAAVLTWTDGQDAINVALPERRLRVAVRFWISEPDATKIGDVKIRIHGALQWADDVLTGSKAGIVLAHDEASDGAPAIVNVAELPGNPTTSIGKNCDNASLIKANAAIYDDAAINVYYVPSIGGGTGGAPKGFNCVSRDAPNIIFIDDDGADESTLVHEIGHGLGLSAPEWGHTDLMDGFALAPPAPNADAHLNTMSYSGVLANYLSLGQVTRMHLSTMSWLNLPSGAGGASTVRTRQLALLGSASTTVCGCPDTAVTPDCGALALDTPHMGTLTAGDAHVYACSVSVASQIDVPCHTTATLTASFMQGAMNANADSQWQVLTPNVVTVTAAPGTPHAPAVNLSGEHHGSAVIRSWAGGVFGTTLAVVPAGCP